MSDADKKRDQTDPTADYLAPFETFSAYELRQGMFYRGRIRPEFAENRTELERLLRTAPGEHKLEEIDGRLYANLRTYDGQFRPHRRLWLHVTLLVLTIITTMGAGAELSNPNPREMALLPFEFVVDSTTCALLGDWDELVRHIWPEFARKMATGIPYALALIFILLSHEMGHYIAARKYGIDATLPFFIPAPFLFGTLGAIIKMRSPITHRRSLFDVGAAGPIAGLIASIIVCCIGLGLSTYVPRATAGDPSLMLGWSPMLSALTTLVLGPGLDGWVVELHNVAIAGWFGLFVTFLNLMPLGQLDGGHVWYALIGRKQRYVALAAMTLLFAMGYVFQFPGWLMLAAFVLLVLHVYHPPVMDESVSIGPVRVIIGIVLILAFLLMFTPQPIVVVEFGG